MTERTLATGASLTSATWADFVSRLRHDCVGEGARDHATADAIFTVQARRIVAGIDERYTDNFMIICGEDHWESPTACWDGSDKEKRNVLNAAAQNGHEKNFLELDVSEQWSVLGAFRNHTVTGWNEHWVHVNSHLTHDAANAFIARKSHDYPDGLRVYVESQYYAWEFNSIKEAILSGKLTYSEVTNG